MSFFLTSFALLCRKYDIIALLVEIAKSAVKEKVVRVSIATLRVRNYMNRE